MKVIVSSFKKVNAFLFCCLITSTTVIAQNNDSTPLLIHAARIFDGINIKTNESILVVDGKVNRIDKRENFTATNAREVDLGDATVLPGFIELHAHLGFQHIPEDVVLRHGVTTLRDVGGPLHETYGGEGRLRVLTSGPILTVSEGYPIINLGTENIAIAIASEQQAKTVVRDLIKGGAAIIKIALEPGGETGAPWTHHHHQQTHDHHPKKEWPMLSEELVNVIVDEAHKLGRTVTAHIGETKGAKIALTAGVDEWAHIPCAPISEVILKEVVAKHVTIVTTLDTLSKCPGAAHNAHVLASLGAQLLYGAEIAHPDIPWGIDAQELIAIKQATNSETLEVLQSASSKSGQHLSIPLLGTLQESAPADIIAVKGNPIDNLKLLEYPDFVMSGGKVVVNNFSSLPYLE
ncbi:MAG: amidohydrolase [Methylococcales bacterium]|nr:MAG: amidohydrolase [Methylococcales bacterium]